MRRLQTILFQKYWLPLSEHAYWHSSDSIVSNGTTQKVFTAGIEQVASRLRELPPAEKLQPREILELLAPFYVYEVKAALDLSILTEQRAIPTKEGWKYRYRCTRDVSIDAYLSAGQEKFRAAVAVPHDFEYYSLLKVVAEEYFGRALRLPRKVYTNREIESTHTPMES